MQQVLLSNMWRSFVEFPSSSSIIYAIVPLQTIKASQLGCIANLYPAASNDWLSFLTLLTTSVLGISSLKPRGSRQLAKFAASLQCTLMIVGLKTFRSQFPMRGSTARAPVLKIKIKNASFLLHAKSSTKRLLLPRLSKGGLSSAVTNSNNLITLTN